MTEQDQQLDQAEEQEQEQPEQDGQEAAQEGSDGTETEPETFPRAYVEKLRQEAAEHRTKAKDRDALAQRLHTALVAATGRLADATDLVFDEAHLESEEALNAAVDDLLARKPHLASRRPTGDIGQGATGTDQVVDLAAMLRARA